MLPFSHLQWPDTCCCIGHLDMQANYTEDMNNMFLTTTTEASMSDGQLMWSCRSLNLCSPLPLQLLLGRVKLPVGARHLPFIGACTTLIRQWYLNSVNLQSQYPIK